MQQTIANPKILLLKGAIDYQRIENKFSSLEPLILQVCAGLLLFVFNLLV